MASRRVFFNSFAFVSSNLIVSEKKSSLELARFAVALGTAHMHLPYVRWPQEKYRLACLLANKTDEKRKGTGNKDVYFSKLPHSTILKSLLATKWKKKPGSLVASVARPVLQPWLHKTGGLLGPEPYQRALSRHHGTGCLVMFRSFCANIHHKP